MYRPGEGRRKLQDLPSFVVAAEPKAAPEELTRELVESDPFGHFVRALSNGNLLEERLGLGTVRQKLTRRIDPHDLQRGEPGWVHGLEEVLNLGVGLQLV